MQIVLYLMPWVWSAIFIGAVIFEIKTKDIDAIWFASGSLIALIAAIINPKLHLVLQLSIFILTTIVLLFTIGRLAKRKLREKNIAANSDVLVGKEILILENCNEFNKGSGNINDVVWTTLCQAGTSLKKGDHAIIVAIDGNHLIVKSKEKNI